MARCESRLSCINIKKISKIKNISQFGLEQNVRERERERKEREREREEREKKTSFFGDFTRFFQLELGMPRVKVALYDESYTWIPES